MRIGRTLLHCSHCRQQIMHDVRFNHVGMAREIACQVCHHASVPSAELKEIIRRVFD